jgi:hypothetical protein
MRAVMPAPQRPPDLGQDVGADGVDSERGERARSFGAVDRPRDHAPARRMDRVHQRRVDQRPLRPHVQRTGLLHRRRHVDRGSIEENPAADLGRHLVDPPHGRVVEAVHCAALRRRRGANRLHRARLGPGTLQLDEEARATLHQREYFVEGGDERAPAHRESLELIEGERVDAAAGELAAGCDRAWNLIVVNDENRIAAPVHVELDAIGAELERADKGGKGVLGTLARCAPVRD